MPTYKKSCTAPHKMNSQSLHYAVMAGDEELVSELLTRGAKVDTKRFEDDDMAAVQLTAMLGHIEILRAFLDSGADVKCVHRNWWTALHYAANGGDELILSLRLANMNSVDKFAATSLHYTAISCYDKIVTMLIDNEADIKCIDDNGWTALHHASRNGYGEVVSALLEGGNRSSTAIMHASIGEHEKILWILLDIGANVLTIMV